MSLLFAQLTHAIGLNDVCDSLRHHGAKLGAIRGAVPPSRNTLSHANKHRNSDMLEELFWTVLSHLQSLNPKSDRRAATVVCPTASSELSMQSIPPRLLWLPTAWTGPSTAVAAAAKMHLRLNLQTFLPEFAIIEEASHHDDTRHCPVCGAASGRDSRLRQGLRPLANLFNLTGRHFWAERRTTCATTSVARLRKPEDNIIRDDEITLVTPKSRADYTEAALLEAWVEINGEWTTMVFLTNHFEWAASSVCDLYRCRWGIEAFFKQIKQTFKVCDFLGHSKHAIRWQLWSALPLCPAALYRIPKSVAT